MTKNELIAKLTTLHAAAYAKLDDADPELKHAKNEDLVNATLPLTLYETAYSYVDTSGMPTAGFVRPITVTRFGVMPRATSPSIDFTDSNLRKAHGSVCDFYLNQEDAQAEVDNYLAHAAKETAEEQLHVMVRKYLPLLLAP